VASRACAVASLARAATPVTRFQRIAQSCTCCR